jgi:hypothetical protein
MANRSTEFDTDALSEEQLADARARLKKMNADNPPAAAPPAPAETQAAPTSTPVLRKGLKRDREEGARNVVLHLNPEQAAQLDAAMKKADRDQPDFVRICVRENFKSFITLRKD